MKLSELQQKFGLLPNVIQALNDLKNSQGSTLQHIVSQVKRNVRGNVVCQVQRALRGAMMAGFVNQPKRGRYKIDNIHLPTTVVRMVATQRGRNRKDYCGTCKKGRKRRRRSRSRCRRRRRSRRRCRRRSSNSTKEESSPPVNKHAQYYKSTRYYRQKLPDYVDDKYNPLHKWPVKKSQPKRPRKIANELKSKIKVCNEFDEPNSSMPDIEPKSENDSDNNIDLDNENNVTDNNYVVKDPKKSDHNGEAKDNNNLTPQ